MILLNYNRSGTISRGGGGGGGGRFKPTLCSALQVDPVLFKNFVKKISFLYP